MTNRESMFANPRQDLRFEDCDFYHVMEIPGIGVTTGQWDLRRGVDAYLGSVAFAGRRVLEIGPGSGFLTFEMERRGATVVAVELPDEPGWDFVPYPTEILAPVYGPRRKIMRRLKNSFWFAHAAYHSNAKLLYATVDRLPDALGTFDVAVMGSILLHCKSPLEIVQHCGVRASCMIITDLFCPDLEGQPVCRLYPTVENQAWHTWWGFSTEFFVQFLRVMGFRSIQVSTHVQLGHGIPRTLFTIVAGRMPTADEITIQANCPPVTASPGTEPGTT